MEVHKDDPNNLVLCILRDGEQAGRMVLTAHEADQFIAGIAKCRASMKPAVELAVDANRLPPAPQDPMYVVVAVPRLPGKTIAVRHPGLGWLAFAYHDGEAGKLGRALLRGIERQSPQPAVTRH
jgi:hypothetical protein